MRKRMKMIKAGSPADLEFSSGTAVFDQEKDESLYATIKRADDRMYDAKHGITKPEEQMTFF
jgi:hypothetical protein